MGKFLSENDVCSEGKVVTGRRGNCSTVFWSVFAKDVGTNGGGTCDIGCGTGELWVIYSVFLTDGDEDGIKDGGGQ